MRSDDAHIQSTVRHASCLILLLLACLLPMESRADITVTLRLRDAGSGAPTDARVRILTPDGWAFAELDAELLTHASESTGPYVHVSDSLAVAGPAGEWSFLVSRGISSIPVYRTVTIDESSTVEVTLDDWIDPRVDGWYGADPHVHLFHDEGLYYDAIPVDRAATAARAEGLDLMYLLENDDLHPGGPVVPAEAGVTLAWGEEYRNSFWGHTVWLGLGDLVWYPYSGAGCCGTLFPAWPTLAQTFHEQDTGLKILAHPRSTDDPLDAFDGWPGSGYARERAALALGDQLHGFAVASGSNDDEAWDFQAYLDALRSGARWAAVGEGDRSLDRYEVSPPGSPRTYAGIGTGWTSGDPAMVAAWESAVRARHCFATTGPIVRDFGIEGVPMGGEYVAGSPGTVDVAISVASYRSITRIRLHGATGTHWDFVPPLWTNVLDTTLTLAIDHDDFVLLEVEARQLGWPELVYPPRAVTSPIWIEAGSPWPIDPGIARREIDVLEAFFAQAIAVRGFDSSADSIAAREDIVGAAALYEAMVDDPPAGFGLLEPAQGADILATSVELSWSASESYDEEPLSYHLVVARDAGFVDVAVDLVTTDLSYLLEGVDSPTSFHWKVEAVEPGDPPTLASGAPRSFFLTGGVVSAPPFSAPPLQIRATGANASAVHLSLALRDPMAVTLRWVDVRGRVVGERNLGRMPGGVRQLTVPARDRDGRTLARGVYWLVAEAGPHREVVRVTWLR